MANGRIDSNLIDLGTLDQNYLNGLQTRSGLNFTDLIAALAAELQLINDGVDPLIAELMYPTAAAEAGAPTEVRGFEARRRGEYTPGRLQYGERSLNYLLPIDDWEISLGFTEDKLQDIRLPEFQAQLRGLRAGWEAFHRRELLSALFRIETVRVGKGTANMSPGFAGSGTGDLAFQGLFPDNIAVPGGYSHYLRDTAANLGVVTLAAVKLLRRWYAGPFDLIAGGNVIDQITALPGGVYVSAGSALIRQGVGAAEAQVDATRFVGVLHGDIRVHLSVQDIPDTYLDIYKSFGQLAIGNPLAWRYDNLVGREVAVKSRSMYPLHDANSVQRFGVGVGNRTAAVAIKLAASGSYTSPVI